MEFPELCNFASISLSHVSFLICGGQSETDAVDSFCCFKAANFLSATDVSA